MYYNESNYKLVLITILGVVLLGLFGYALIPDIATMITNKISVIFDNFIASQNV